MATLIDSSVLLAAERGQLNFDQIATRYEEEDVAISAVTASELLHGTSREDSGATPPAPGLRRGPAGPASCHCLRPHRRKGTRVAVG